MRILSRGGAHLLFRLTGLAIGTFCATTLMALLLVVRHQNLGGAVWAICFFLGACMSDCAGWGAFDVKKAPRLPEAVDEELQRYVSVPGLMKSAALFGSLSKAEADYPRPLALWGKIMVSRRTLEEYSPQALRWSIKSERIASAKSVMTIMWCRLIFLLASTAGIFAGNPPTLSYATSLLLFFVLMAMLIGLIAACFRFQFQADAQCTETEMDRQAAKEALGYSYFAQADRERLNRWFFFRSELSARASRLGITLERGYKATAKPN